MKVNLVTLKTMGLGLILMIVGIVAASIKVVADAVSVVSQEIVGASFGRLEKLSF